MGIMFRAATQGELQLEDYDGTSERDQLSDRT